MKLRIALAQINVTVGALDQNRRRIAERMAQARDGGAAMVLFPELAVTGYPPEDLLFKPAFVRDARRAADSLAASSRGLTAVVGFLDQDRDGVLYNAAAVYSQGRRRAVYRKMILPNYGVFDEKRYFTPGTRPLVLECAEGKIGISICEDIWVEHGPCRVESSAGARLLLNISASPYHAGKRLERERLLAARARQCRSWIVYVNLVGGQDELVFDGGSLVVSPTGKVVFRAPQFEEGLFFVEVPLLPAEKNRRLISSDVGWVAVSLPVSRKRVFRTARSAVSLRSDEEIFRALMLGLRDYVRKNRFSHVVLGLSGGIDSNLTAAIAAAALGPDAVTGVSMPSRYSSEGTRSDARRAAEALGISFLELSIEPLFQTALASLEEAIGPASAGLPEENLQARIRGTLLMALSNRFGWLVLATGNKSEISTGYCTLYGDMVGGFAVIKDVPKTWVYRLARVANRFFRKGVIPESVIRRAPTAELKPRQKDQDTLPPYPKLDAILRAYVEERLPAAEIGRRRPSLRKELGRVIRMIDSNEYKRRQAAPGIKITPLAFGKERRMPITNAYREI